MANQVTGMIIQIGQTYQVPTNNGTQFVKRELILDASTYDRYTGQKRENYVNMEFVQNNCTKLDQFQVGDLVTVSFVLVGRKHEKDGNVRYFTNVTGYDLVKLRNEANQGAQGGQSPAPAQQPTQEAQSSQQGSFVSQTAPTGAPQQPFPPAVDENGNPIEGNADNLPF